MPLKEHPAYDQELKRLSHTKKNIENFIVNIQKNKEVYKENIREAFVNLDYLDSSQSYISILTNAKFLELDSSHLDELQKSRKRPYFGRIDFKDHNSDRAESLYIGKVSLPDKENKKILILDWRAPIANVYYEGRLGEVSYQTPRGSISGELVLKRQYAINEGKLENILDIDITTNDTFLQASLEVNADKKLKDIAATIQSEQNSIIRADMNMPLIVQGVAGSGKTTIALHRIAYLIYTYEDSFIPENFMIIAPNRLFLDYISEVLPELGVERVKQTTIVELFRELLGEKYKFTGTNEKIILFIDRENANEEADRLSKRSSFFKGTRAFKDIIDGYIKELEQDFVPGEDFSLGDHVIVNSGEIRRLFLEEYNHLPLYKRIDEIKKHLSYKLKSSREKIVEEIENRYNRIMDQVRALAIDDEEKRTELVTLIDAKNDEIESIKKSFRTLVSKYIALFPKHDLLYYYKNIVAGEVVRKFASENLDAEFISFFCSHSEGILKKKQVEIEDGAALIYLKNLLFGFDKDLDIKHIVIDEAQDLSLFQIYAMKRILGTERFTIFGDLAQGIHSYRSLSNWDSVAKEVFPDGCNYLTLEQSYRTTIEIMNTANEVIKKHVPPGVALAKPVIRHGDKPEIIVFKSAEEIIGTVKKQVKKLQANGYKSIALICKSMEECKRIKKYLDKESGISVRLLTGEENAYHSGITLVPSYIAKGLEFDAVFIINIEDKYSSSDIDIKLLYVAMTRALHKLFVYYRENTIYSFS
ncbi:MAG: RNA polymerase recycling motor HelD [Bacillota bacterium]